MAEIKLPIKIDFSYVILDALRRIESDRDDYMYLQGFYDCRDVMISTIENFLDEHMNDLNMEYDKDVMTEDVTSEDVMPCESCATKDYCDHWEAMFCCDLCRWLGAEHCDDCDPMDI